MTNQSVGQGVKDSGTMTVESRYLRDFQRHKPPSFDGGKVDPIAAENWLEAIETTFHFMNCPLKYQFKDAYLHKYYPITARVKMQTSFLELKQGDRSAEEYDLEFKRLARFSPAYVSSDELEAERFIAGLREERKENVASQSSFVYAKAF
ncbi:uncharacterized protein LOC111434045 [Cucurbita moschata]|uniref:Uncharacterized protein LOC111434045 n=1 Tax=Cucurbita moschata TaxID=3662 RepID=A0A6J1EK33_CUCMO|nr:uncharacterized protein LOC111434045 [Cucurbita moschata]